MVKKQLEDSSDEDNEKGVEIFENEQKRVGTSLKNKGALRNKVRFITKMLKIQRVLREEREHVLRIKAMNNDKLPQGILSEGKQALEAFKEFKRRDSINEMRPY